MKVKRFHQFVQLETGPKNTALIDLLSGEVYQVENQFLDKFAKAEYQQISELVQSLEREELIFSCEAETWIPRYNLKKIDFDTWPMQIEIEEGADLELIAEKLRSLPLAKVTFFGKSRPQIAWADGEIDYQSKDFNRCIALATVSLGNFRKMAEQTYAFNMKFNSCWGRKIAIDKGNTVKPCLFSDQELGNLKESNIYDLIEKLTPFWELTKREIVKCQECEFKYVCFDCRVIAQQRGGDLHAPNPLCQYDPHTGT